MGTALSNALCDEEMKSNRPYEESALWVTPGDGFLSIIRRAGALVRKEGFRGLLGGLGRFAGTLTQKVYRNERFRLYELRVDEAGPILLSAPFEGVELHVIETREDAYRLVAQGYEDVILGNPHHARRLNSGSIAVCAYVSREFASIDWMAFSETAKRSFDKLSYGVALEKGEVYTGGAFTAMSFRGLGIATYRFGHELCYMRDHGCRLCRNGIAIDNVPSQRLDIRPGSRGKLRGIFINNCQS